MMDAIYLTGFMGAGKTTVGKALGEKLGISVIDTDAVIVNKENRPIDTIFREEGEDSFRRKETAVLYELPTKDVIVTTGGGIVLKKENRDYMKKHGIVFFLYCSPEKTYARLENDTSRPLLKGDKRKEIASRLVERMDRYLEADYVIDTSDLTIEETVAQISAHLDKMK